MGKITDTDDVLRRLARLQRDTERQLAVLRVEAESLRAIVAEPAPQLDVAEQDRRLAVALDRDALLDRDRADAAFAEAEQARAEHARAVAAHRERIAAARARLAEVDRELIRHEQVAEAAAREVRAELSRIGRGRLESEKLKVYAAVDALVRAMVDWSAMAALANADSPHESARNPRGFELVIPKCESADRPEGVIGDFVGFNAIVVDTFKSERIAERRLSELRAQLLGEPSDESTNEEGEL